jgi:glutamate--cysteine ligase
MPTRRPTLDVATARAIAAQAFVPSSPGPLWGVEAEWIVHRATDPAARVPREDLRPLTRRMPSSGKVTLEPGGQVEISTAPVPCLDVVLDALAADTSLLSRRLAEAGLRAVSSPVDIRRPPRRILALPRYQAMEAFFDATGTAGRWMMCNTAALQINLSHQAGDPAQRWRVMHAIGPVLAATFANSPGRDVSGRHWASLRLGIWQTLDHGRTRTPSLSCPPGEAWADYVLAADVMMIRTGSQAAVVPPGMPFDRWLHEGHRLGWPTAGDLRYHMTTLFPPIRPRGWLELRMIDALPPSVQEIAVLTVAAAAREEAASELLERLPCTGSRWLTAARLGLADDELAAAAVTLFEVTAAALPQVTARADRIAAVAEYRGRFVARRAQPWGGNVTNTALTRTRVPPLGEDSLPGRAARTIRTRPAVCAAAAPAPSVRPG